MPHVDEATRWAAAASLAQGVPDDGVGRRRTRMLLGLAAFLVVGMLAVVPLLPDPSPAETGRGLWTWGLGLQLAVLAAAVVIIALGLLWAELTGRNVSGWLLVSSPLRWSERRVVWRQISGRAPLDASRAPVLVALARQYRRNLEGQLPTSAAVVLIVVVALQGLPPSWLAWLGVPYVTAVVAQAVRATLRYRQAGHFLRRHGEAARSQTASGIMSA